MLFLQANCQVGCHRRAPARPPFDPGHPATPDTYPNTGLGPSEPVTGAAAAPPVAVAATRRPGSTGDGGPTFIPGTAAAKQKGVNFSRRIAAERTSVFLCTEHSLLSDGWRGYLDRAHQAGLTTTALDSALNQLRQQLSVSKGRGGHKRRGTLTTQIDRLEAWRQERGGSGAEAPVCPVSDEVAAAAADEWCVDESCMAAAAPGSERTRRQKSEGASHDDVRTAGESAEWSAFFPLLNLWADT